MNIFIVITPGLEDLALKEIEEKCPLSEYTLIKGGIEATVDPLWIHNAHHLLKIPTRLLLRLSEFKVRDFPKLLSKLQNLKWKEFLSHPQPKFHISATKSRLLHTGRIEELCHKAVNEHLAQQPLSLDWQKKNYSPQNFYLRLFDDYLTFSVDLSGLPLYKRGEGLIKGEAPLRENYASALIYELMENISEEVHLFDPMCGSGTFLYEALSFYQSSRRPFAYTENPLFKGKHFAIPKLSQQLKIKSVKGLEINQELVEKLKRDYIQSGDSLKDSYQLAQPLVIICNPPYGERIQVAGKRGQFLREAFNTFISHNPLKLGWLIPTDMEDIFKSNSTHKIVKTRRFRNGGIMVSFIVWERI